MKKSNNLETMNEWTNVWMNEIDEWMNEGIYDGDVWMIIQNNKWVLWMKYSHKC